MKRLLVLRPEPGATGTVESARQRSLDARALPLFEIRPVGWDVPDASKFDALLLTSSNAVRHGGAGLRQLRHLSVHAVGTATADVARSAGFTIASTGDGGVDALLASLDPRLRLLHLCGEHRRIPANSAQELTSVIVYLSEETPAPDMSVAQNAVTLIHSPRAGRRFAELVDNAGLDRRAITIAAISYAAAEAAGDGWAAIEVAEEPNDDALLALAERLCNKPEA